MLAWNVLIKALKLLALFWCKFAFFIFVKRKKKSKFVAYFNLYYYIFKYRDSKIMTCKRIILAVHCLWHLIEIKWDSQNLDFFFFLNSIKWKLKKIIVACDHILYYNLINYGFKLFQTKTIFVNYWQEWLLDISKFWMYNYGNFEFTSYSKKLMFVFLTIFLPIYAFFVTVCTKNNVNTQTESIY